MAWPTLLVLRKQAGPMANKDIVTAVADEMSLSNVQRSILRSKTGRGSRTLLDYRLAWSRTLLKGIGAIENPEPAHWRVTESGRIIEEARIEEAVLWMIPKRKSAG